MSAEVETAFAAIRQAIKEAREAYGKVQEKCGGEPLPRLEETLRRSCGVLSGDKIQSIRDQLNPLMSGQYEHAIGIRLTPAQVMGSILRSCFSSVMGVRFPVVEAISESDLPSLSEGAEHVLSQSWQVAMSFGSIAHNYPLILGDEASNIPHFGELIEAYQRAAEVIKARFSDFAEELGYVEDENVTLGDLRELAESDLTQSCETSKLRYMRERLLYMTHIPAEKWTP